MDVARFLEIEQEISDLAASTSQIFGATPSISAGNPDAGESPYIVFKVKLDSDSDTKRLRAQKSEWHERAISVLQEKASAARLIVEY